MEKRKIESAAELVSALSNLIILEEEDLSGIWYRNGNNNSIVEKLTKFYNDVEFRYADPVEVEELYFHKDELGRELGYMFYSTEKQCKTHKQTQIIQNDSIIWTKTEKI